MCTGMDLACNTLIKAEEEMRDLLRNGYYIYQIVYGGVVTKWVFRHSRTNRELSMYIHKAAGLVQIYEKKKVLKEIIV